MAASYSASSRANVIREGKDMDINLEPIYKIAKDILSEREQNAGIDIYLVSEVPYGVGLGSSAASCVATGAAIDALFHSPDKNWLYNKATEDAVAYTQRFFWCRLFYFHIWGSKVLHEREGV